MDKKQASILDRIRTLGGLTPGVATEVARATGVPEAEVFGTGSFYHLLANPDTKLRVCTGLSCQLAGAEALLAHAKQAGLPVEGCSCLAACDRPPAVLRERGALVEVTKEDIDQACGDWTQLTSAACPTTDWVGHIGSSSKQTGAMNLSGEPDFSGAALRKALGQSVDETVLELETSGLQGRGGTGFPAAIKWRAVREQADRTRYVVLNADEGEPGTFKDRELLLRRPDLVLEGLAIAAHSVGAQDVYLYLRGEFEGPWRATLAAIDQFTAMGTLGDVAFHVHEGHGAYICGEETALLEALEGKRGMPRLKPPFPTERGLWGKPTLIHNVETIACVPAIVTNGGSWFRNLGRTGPGSKLYSISGHVKRPGNYELPLGVCLDELVAEAGGYVGTLRAFSPGGASSGFLPASERTRPLDFQALADIGSMLGSAGVVVLNDTIDIAWAVNHQLRFFEDESCGQCAPCRIGTRFLREAMDRHRAASATKRDRATELKQVADAAWEMNEGSICGLGQAAPLPLTTALKFFPDDFS